MKLGIVNMFLLLLIILISGTYFGNIVREGMSSSELTRAKAGFAVALDNDNSDYNSDTGAMYDYLKQRGKSRDDSRTDKTDPDYNQWLSSKYSKQGQGGSSYGSVVGNRIPQDYLDRGSGAGGMGAGGMGAGGYGGGDSFDHSDTPTASAQSALPKGIPKSQIPQGSEHLYISKSQVVAPVCPQCPPVISECKKPCQACPECAACPDQPIRCKKVPNYNSTDQRLVPRAVLTNFSTFGM